MDLIAEGQKKGLVRLEDGGKYIVYLHQQKRRNYENPYQEFLYNRNSYTRKALIDKLQNARTQIIKACELNDLQLYSDLRHTIDNALDRFRTNEH